MRIKMKQNVHDRTLHTSFSFFSACMAASTATDGVTPPRTTNKPSKDAARAQEDHIDIGGLARKSKRGWSWRKKWRRHEHEIVPAWHDEVKNHGVQF
jgi:hypothetical protein